LESVIEEEASDLETPASELIDKKKWDKRRYPSPETNFPH